MKHVVRSSSRPDNWPFPRRPPAATQNRPGEQSQNALTPVQEAKTHPPKLGINLALGGGSAKGLCFLGVFKVLEEAGIPICSLTGISAGSVGAAVYGFDPDFARAQERIGGYLLSKAFTGSDFEYYLSLADDYATQFNTFWGSMRKVVALGSLLRAPSLMSAESHRTFIAGMVDEARIEDAAIPIAIVALDIVSGAEVCLREGDLRAAIMASTAITGVFPPVEWGEWRLVDNGLMLPLPINAALRWTSGPLVAVDVSSSHVPSLPDDNGLTLFWRMQQSQAHIIRQSAVRSADLVIRPDVSVVNLPLSEEILADCVHAGERATKEALPTIRRLLLSREDCELLDVILRHRILRPARAAAALTRTIERRRGSLADELLALLGAPALRLIQELAAQVLADASREEVARAMGQAVSSEPCP